MKNVNKYFFHPCTGNLLKVNTMESAYIDTTQASSSLSVFTNITHKHIKWVGENMYLQWFSCEVI